jgi:Holliday junction resolvase RusA-like endonuclease
MVDQTIIFYGQLSTMNEVNNKNRTHWSAGAKLKKQETELIRLQCGKLKPITKPVILTFNWFYSSKADFDNIRSAVKVIQDGMVASGKLPDDNQKWVKGYGGDYFTKCNRGEEKVIVEIEVFD